MLHVLNLAAVLLLPVLASTFPQTNRWKDVYDRRMQTGYPTPPNPLEDDRSGPLRRALQELRLLQHQQSAAQDTPLLPAPEVPALLPPGAGFGGLYAKKREELLARLLGGRSAVLPVPLHELQGGGAPSEGDLMLQDAQKRGGFVGAPGSPGGPNMFGR